MQLIDSTNLLTLRADEIAYLEAEKISDPKAFLSFAEGLTLSSEMLASERWQNAEIGRDDKSMFDFIMEEMLPHFYNLNALKVSGDIGIAISGIGGYTVAAVNERVLVMQGLPIDLANGDPVADFEISPDIFLAFCRGLLLEVSDTVLEADDEFEDRPISDGELIFYGMPAGGSDTGITSSCGTKTSVGTSPCAANTGTCGENISLPSACAANAGACSKNEGGVSACAANAGACGAKGSVGSACAANAGACGVNTSVGSACAAKAAACGAKLSAATACAAKADACGAKLSAGTACGANADATGAGISAGSACGAKANACGVKVKPASVCGAKAGSCGVDVGDLCPANASACGVNLPGDIVSACAINIIPLLPSC
ncbi:hypothetical protein [Desulfogranum mediterraneum]|uniref:hypothetical protein n=1 Tax=Desulfogranum mediterraneum TaxID=160661 RepID=UPI00041E5DA9|nr:hypothetical protein [Desulfogranum mediterraneum]